MNKRITALILAGLILCLPMAQSCNESSSGNNGSDDSSVDSSAETSAVSEALTAEPQSETAKYIEDNLEDADLEGYDYKIFSCEFINRELGEYISYDELTGDMVDDALYNSKMSVEERFNCNISIIRNPVEITSLVQKAVKAGDDICDIQIGPDGATVRNARTGCFYNLFDIKQFDFDKPWWPKNTVEQLSVMNKLYIASSYLSFCGLHYSRVLVLNKDKFEEWNIELPYQTVLDGKWTFDKMLNMVEDVKTDLNGDGKMTPEDDFYGYATGSQTWYCMQDSLDLMPYVHDSDGNVSADINLEKADKYVEMANKLINESGSYVEEGMFGVIPFSEGRALIANSTIQDIYDTYRGSDIRYGIIPTPKFDEDQKEYITSCTDTFWAIPITSMQHLDKTAIITEALSCSNYNKVIPAYFETVLSKKLADAPEDAAMLNIIKDTRTIGFAYAFSLPFADIVSETVKSGKSFSSLFAMKNKMVNKQIDHLIKEYEKIEH